MSAQSPSLKTYFKTPEGRYKLQYEKTHPAGLLHYSHGKAVSQVALYPRSPLELGLGLGALEFGLWLKSIWLRLYLNASCYHFSNKFCSEKSNLVHEMMQILNNQNLIELESY